MSQPHARARGIAIIGMACRFPGASDWRAYWDNLAGGVESIAFFDDASLLAAGIDPATLADPHYVKAAPVLDGIDRFDAAFFEYSPREARIIDPQQRLFLEVSWEAFEDAGYWPEKLGGAAGVFAGAGGVVSSYFAATPSLHGSTGGVEHLGNDKDFLATRISYKLNLTGPSLTVQTACSTSLVALNLACSSILNGECDMALAGAATVRVPHHSGYFSREGDIQSPDGHCRAFDAAARGTVFGSGVGALLLKHVDDALADGDHIYAVIRASAVNNDGAGKVSYTASSVHGQSMAMLDAFDRAGVAPGEIDYIEAHGTGTVVGDPLEIDALTRVFRTDTRRTGFCALGSVKTNIGHLEQSAGVASLIKVALALHHKQMPPTLHFHTPNPRIAFARTPFFVNTALRDWPAREGDSGDSGDTGGKRRLAAVNALGLGGTNAFAILEEAPPPAPRVATAHQRPLHILALSARTAPALREQLARWRKHLAGLDDRQDDNHDKKHDEKHDDEAANALGDHCYTANTGRAPFDVRFTAIGATRAQLAAELEQASPASFGTRAGKRPLAFLFTGQGAQYPGMTAELFRTEPVFRAALERCDQLARLHLDASLLEIIFDEHGTRLHQTAFTQPALFAVEWALAQLWQAWGIVPDAVMGHSVGEYVAACVAGVYSLDDALALIVARARLMQALPAGGAMAALFADGATLESLLAGELGASLSIAACNSPENTVISGSAAAVAAALELARQAGVEGRALSVSHAFHSPLLAPMLDQLEALAARYPAQPPRIALVDNLSGARSTQAPLPAYWRAHALEPVRFADGLRSLAAMGILDYLEIGPGSTLASLAQQTLAGAEHAGKRFLASIGREREWRQLAHSACALWRGGAPFDWRAFDAPFARRRVSAPTYPFQRERYWVEQGKPATGGAPEDLLGARLNSPLPAWQFDSAYGLDQLPWLGDHRIFGHVVLPLTAGLVALTRAAQARWNGAPVAVTGLTYREAVVLPGADALRMHVVLSDSGDGADAELLSLDPAPNGAWRLHMAGRIEQPARPALEHLGQAAADALDRHALRAREPAGYYAAIAPLGFGYGPGFRAIAALWQGDGAAVGQVVLPAHLSPSAHPLHPALLDACLHTYPAVLPEYHDLERLDGGAQGTYLPISVERFEIYRPGAARVWVACSRRTHAGAGAAGAGHTVDIRVYADDGAAVALIAGLNVQRLTAAQIAPPDTAAIANALFRVDWRERPALPEAPAGTPAGTRDGWLVLGAAGAAGAVLEGLGQRNLDAVMHDPRGWREADDAGAAIAAAAALPPGLHGVVLMHALDVRTSLQMSAQELAAAEAHCCRTTLAAVTALAAWAESSAAAPRIWIVTRGASDGADPLHAALWGMGRVAALEHPGLWGGMIDLDPGADPGIGQLVDELLGNRDEPEIALRAGRRHAPRLVRETRAPAPGAAIVPSFDAQASYLITGGLGALGLIVADWLVQRHGVRHLVLTARRPPNAEAAAALAQLEAKGARVTVKAADIGAAADVRTLFDDMARELPPLKGVFHCAGLLDDSVLLQMDWDKYTRVTRPKVLGGWLLHQATREMALDHFVLFSSVLSVVGAMGQVNYVAGNAFLDGLGALRRSASLPAQVINWGPWADTGLATESGKRGEAIWIARGTRYIGAGEGIEAMEAIMAGGLAQTVVSITDWPRWAAQYLAPPPLLQELAGPAAAAAPSRHGDVPARLAGAPPEQRMALLLGVVVDLAGSVLEIDGAINPDQPLRELGLDSLIAITLINQLDALLGVRVAATTMLKGPSAGQLAGELLPKIALSGADPAPPQAHAPAAVATAATAATASRGQWLVEIKRNPQARYRLLCFPFAGGGSAVYRGWADEADPHSEIVAVEPPGRLSRIHEAPLTRIEEFVGALLAELAQLPPLPLALFGHCIGGLTMYETARALIEREGIAPLHLFASGARPPHRLLGDGPFERQLVESLLALPEFSPSLPSHRQPDSVLAEILRHFQIDATAEMLAIPQLRALVLPVVRAEFEMAGRYVFAPSRPWQVPITGFRGRDDLYVTHDDAMAWGALTQAQFRLHTRDGAHFGVVEDRAFIQGVIGATLAASLARQP